MLILDFRTDKMTKMALDFGDAVSLLAQAGLLGLGGAGLGYLIDTRAGTGNRWTKILALLGLLGGLGLSGYSQYQPKTTSIENQPNNNPPPPQEPPNEPSNVAQPLSVSDSNRKPSEPPNARTTAENRLNTPQITSGQLPGTSPTSPAPAGSPPITTPTSNNAQSGGPSAKTPSPGPSSGSSGALPTSGSSSNLSNQQQTSVSTRSSASSSGTKPPNNPPAVQPPQRLHSESSNITQSPSASSGRPSGTPSTSSKPSSGPSNQQQTSVSIGSSTSLSGTKPPFTGIRLSDDFAQRSVNSVRKFLKDTRERPSDKNRYRDLDRPPTEMCVRLVLRGFQDGYYLPDARAYQAAAEFARGDEQKQRAIRLAKRFSARIYLLSLLQPAFSREMEQDITQRIGNALMALQGLMPDASNADEIDNYFANRLRGLFSNEIINRALTDPFSISPEPR